MAITQYYALKRQARQCGWCGKPAVAGGWSCEECKAKARARVAARKASGRCARCPEPPLTGMTQCRKCLDKRIALDRKNKADAMSAYGGKCECCGEAEIMFLAIDHIDGKGKQHRKDINCGGSGFYRWLKNNKYPPGFRVLCHNCNIGRHINGGVCPHAVKTLAAERG